MAADLHQDILDHHDKVLIIDFGSQVTQLIARRVREAGVYCEIAPFQSAEAAFAAIRPKAVILSGGPSSVLEDGSPRAPQAVFEAGIPVLGICYGQQLMAAQLGGTVSSSHHGEFGRADVEITDASPLFDGVWEQGGRYPVWMSHGDRLTALPDGFRGIGRSENAPVAIIADDRRRFYGVQFHLEVHHTPQGARILSNFVHKIAGCRSDWTMKAFRQEAVAAIRTKVGETGRVLCGLSGGVDSAVAAVLIHEAIGDRLTCVYVDHGLMREGESEQIVSLFREHFAIPLVHVEAADLFLGSLHGIRDPEQKRKIIGGLFVATFEGEAKKLVTAAQGAPEFLAQGTLYPDVIESVSFSGGPSVTIKSHHNVGGLPRAHEHEARRAACASCSRTRCARSAASSACPRPSSAAIRFPAPASPFAAPAPSRRTSSTSCASADAIYLDEIRRAGLYDTIWQAFAVLLPVQSVGVMGDGRTYDFVCALRAVTSVDGMTADFFPFDMNVLGRAATRIINEVKGINRVVYDVTSKPPGTIEWE